MGEPTHQQWLDLVNEWKDRYVAAENQANQLRSDRDGWMQIAGMHELEVDRLRAELQAIAAKGPASPGDKKAQMAKNALEETSGTTDAR